MTGMCRQEERITATRYTIETGGLDRLQKVLGIFDENLVTIARELELFTKVEGTNIVLEGEAENAALGKEVVESLLAIVEAGDNIDKSSLLYSCLLWVFVMLFPQGFAAMFTSDGSLLSYTQMALRIYMGSMFLFGIQMACQMTFISLGNAKASILVAVMRKFILLLPLIYIMPHIFTADKARAVYMAEPVADFLAICFTSVLFYFQFKKALRQMQGA